MVVRCLCYTYILQCADQTLYTGWTNNLKKRLTTHQKGLGAKYTRVRLPVQLVYVEVFQDKVSAQRREYQIKQLRRSEKLRLIAAQHVPPTNLLKGLE